MGVDGLKTGHLSISGYGLAASAVEGNRRVISVTNGFSHSKKGLRAHQDLLLGHLENMKILSYLKSLKKLT